jgi:AraC-like DNA-binding protein
VPVFTRTSGFGPLPRIVEMAGGRRALARLLGARGLPYALIASPMLFAPIPEFMAVFEDAARLLGDHSFGITVGQRMSPFDFGPVSRYAASAPTVIQAIERLEQAMPYHSTAFVFELQPRGDVLCWRFWVNADLREGRHHHAVHILLPMLTFLRACCDDGSLLQAIEVETADAAACRRLETIFGLPVMPGAAANGILFHRRALAARVQYAVPDELRIESPQAFNRIVRQRAPSDRMGAILETAKLHLSGGWTGLDRVAEQLRLSRRSIQRCLDNHGMNYRDLIDRLRLDEAKRRLLEDGRSVKSAALSLGYADTAHFNRAFRRWTGLAPSEYQRASVPG